ncbi:pseudaminic acid cytidylyltransferase [Guyparkeria halophila]|uniref:Pseudaminic acid cytidylyltransferase n=1 Tax=Guyparkeria halophila TaxID=47960 RepID=A0ABZ0YY83_9GAMM|nr:pseudaminic acid cytidylyltransferase [Guyparkeria halophila]WQH17142.1 pseudaminic acid cytidylyltransferase [Guyparkeria halophila]
MRLAVIPARGGSKRIPRKNIRDFGGKPMIAWSIEAAHQSGRFDRVIVSTDDPELAEVARTYGAEVPFFRPASLAGDQVGTRPVLHHALGYFAQAGETIDYVLFIYATAPFVTGRRLAASLDDWLAASGRPERAMAVTSFAYPPQRGFVLDRAGRIVPPRPEMIASRSQDLPAMYHDAGQFYFTRPDREGVIHDLPFIHPETWPVVLPHYLVQDIDDEDDWIRAEAMFQYIRRHEA